MNYMEQVAQMLGVELDEEFNVKGHTYKYKLTKSGIVGYSKTLGDWSYSNHTLLNILIGKYEIKRTILDEVEKEYLSNVIKPFKDRVISIIKYDNGNYEYIGITFRDFDKMRRVVFFPKFEKHSMYKGMITDKAYSLNELGL